MSYMSGMMMGMAVGKGLGSMLMGGAASGGFSALGAGASRLLGGGASVFGRGGASAFGRGAGRGAGRGRSQDGSDFGENIAKFLKGGAKKRSVSDFELAQSIPGRRRYYAKALLGNDALAEAVEKSLAQIDFIDEVKANPVSGSLLLIHHGEEAQIDRIAEQLASRVFAAPSAKGETEMGAPDASASHEGTAEGLAAFGQSIRGTINAINHQMKSLTGGWLDLPSLLSLVFTVQGLQKILVSKQLPSGPQLIWWAFSLLRGWRIA